MKDGVVYKLKGAAGRHRLLKPARSGAAARGAAEAPAEAFSVKQQLEIAFPNP